MLNEQCLDNVHENEWVQMLNEQCLDDMHENEWVHMLNEHCLDNLEFRWHRTCSW